LALKLSHLAVAVSVSYYRNSAVDVRVPGFSLKSVSRFLYDSHLLHFRASPAAPAGLFDLLPTFTPFSFLVFASIRLALLGGGPLGYIQVEAIFCWIPSFYLLFVTAVFSRRSVPLCMKFLFNGRRGFPGFLFFFIFLLTLYAGFFLF